jgi:hypothetical protein
MDSHDVDIRTDIYSLGVTFYFLLTGQPPFEGVPITQKLLAHQTKQPKPITEFRKDVPAAVRAILDKMMAKKVDQRYAVPGDVADALQPFTQVAIAPPADAEMPKLSPAATGQPIAGDAETTVSKNDTPVASPPTLPRSVANPLKNVSAAVAAAPSPSGAGQAKAVAAAPSPLAAAAPPASPTAPAETPEHSPWEPFATGITAAPDAATGQPGRTSSRSRSAPIDSNNKSIVVVVLVMAFLAVASFLTAVIISVIWFLSPSLDQPARGGPPKLEVSRDPSRRNTYTSILAAARNAEFGAVIELWDDTYEENVVIEGGPNQRTNFTLQAAPGKEIIWRPARNDAKQPILTLRKAVEFTLKGKGITFDGTLADKKRSVNDLIEISFESPGLVVEDAHFKNFARSAVFVINGAGSAGQPIKLQRLTTESADKTRAAIYFDANPTVLPPVNDHIEIEDCIFLGHDPAQAIQFKEIKDKSVFGNNVRWPGR